MGSGIRLQPVVHLASGDVVGQVAETERAFEDTVRFGPAAHSAALPSVVAPQNENAAEQVARTIEQAAALSRLLERWARPVHVTVPMAALMAPGLAEACQAAAARARLCPQEICLGVADSALLHRGRDMVSVVRSLRRVGLRVGIDARRTWDAPLGDALSLLLDSVTVRLSDLERSPDLEDRVAAADGAGMGVIVAGARWRDGPWLAELGISLAIAPRHDG